MIPMQDEEKDTKRKPKKKMKKSTIIRLVLFLAVLVAGGLSLLFYVTRSPKSLDKLQRYEVAVSPLEDGSLRIKYTFHWEVLDSTSEVPLSWVKVGMANYDFTVEKYGGAIKHISGGTSTSPYVSASLDRDYEKGEVAKFWFTVIQKRMLCRDPDSQNRLMYDFTPGWFNSMEVDSYLFTWEKADTIVEHNADRTETERLCWSGKLDKGEKVNIQIHYDKAAFPDAMTFTNKPTTATDDDDTRADAGVVVMILMLTGFGGIMALGAGRSGYGRGRHYHHHSGFHGGHGCACACACAGCACACACAGGGRAGCTTKDFYQPNPFADACEKAAEEKDS